MKTPQIIEMLDEVASGKRTEVRVQQEYALQILGYLRVSEERARGWETAAVAAGERAAAIEIDRIKEIARLRDRIEVLERRFDGRIA